MKLHTGDLVVIIAGKEKGKTGRILRVLHATNRVVVAGANLRTRHIRKTPQAPGRIVRYEASLHASNVMIVDPKTKKRSRIGLRLHGTKKNRIAKRSGEELTSGRALKKLLEQEEKAATGSSESDEKTEQKASAKKTSKKSKTA